MVIVHNGIIENYDTLKKELINRGYTPLKVIQTLRFWSILIEEVKKEEECKLGKAVQLALTQVIGAYAIAVFDRSKPNEIIVARLRKSYCHWCRRGTIEEFFVASDASPFIEFTKDAIYLEDEEMAIIKLRIRVFM